MFALPQEILVKNLNLMADVSSESTHKDVVWTTFLQDGTQCDGAGVFAENTKGRLLNCVITQCNYSGIFCRENALIELEGDQTKVDGNVTSE